jgi:hypothetical protein
VDRHAGMAKFGGADGIRTHDLPGKTGTRYTRLDMNPFGGADGIRTHDLLDAIEALTYF